MPHGTAKKVVRRMEEARKYLGEWGCTTLSMLAKALGATWEQARRAADLLEARGEAAVFTYGGKLLWCVNSEEAAAEAIHKLRLELWRVLCSSRRRFVSPTEAARLVAADPQARKAFSKFTSLTKITAGTLAFIDAALADLLGEAFDRRTNKKIYMVRTDICAKPPRRTEPKRYKPRRNLVTFRVTEAMARDIEKAAAALGVEKPRLIRMAIERLLKQYGVKI